MAQELQPKESVNGKSLRSHAAVRMCALLFIGTLWIYASFLGGTEDHIRAHLSLTRALAEDGTVVADRFANQTHDLAFFEGHFFVAKPPGFAFTVSPVWWLLAQMGHGFDPAWRITTFLFSTLPGAVSVVVFFLLSRRLGAGTGLSLVSSILYALGTGVFAYSTLFLEAPLLILTLLASLLVLLHPERPRWTNLLVGGLIGYAVLLHYIVALCALPVAVFVALKTRSRLAVVLFLAGFLVPLSGALVYNYLCFSDPFVFGHFRSAVPEFQDFHEGMIEGFLVPRPQALWGLSFSPSKGLFFFSPVLLVATFGLVRLFHCPRHRAQAILLTAIFGATFVLVSSLPNWQGGLLSGPRYLLPVVPVLALGLAGLEGFDSGRIRVALAVLLATCAVWSIGIWSMLAIVAPFSPEWLSNPIFEKHLPDLMRGQIRPTVGGLYLGLGRTASLALAIVPTVCLYALAWAKDRMTPRENTDATS